MYKFLRAAVDGLASFFSPCLVGGAWMQSALGSSADVLRRESRFMTSDGSFHETWDRPDAVKISSDRSFGLIFAGVFLAYGALKVWGGHGFGWGVLGLGAAFALIAAVAPALLHPLNRVWFRFGLLLQRVMNPVVMGLLFFGTILPVGLTMRALGSRPLGLCFNAKADSYWIKRPPRDAHSATLTTQF
jgi:hypothetical protein